MSKEFEFEIVGNERSFVRLLEKNNIHYTRTLEPSVRRRTTRTREDSEVYDFCSESILSVLTNEITVRFLIALTPFTLDKIWKWSKRKRKDSTNLSVTVEGNLLKLDAKSKKLLGKLLLKSCKEKTRRKRGKPK